MLHFQSLENFSDDYIIIHKSLALNNNLKCEEKGLLLTMLAQKVGSERTREQIAEQYTMDGARAFGRIFKSCKSKGFIKQTQYRQGKLIAYKTKVYQLRKIEQTSEANELITKIAAATGKTESDVLEIAQLLGVLEPNTKTKEPVTQQAAKSVNFSEQIRQDVKFLQHTLNKCTAENNTITEKQIQAFIIEFISEVNALNTEHKTYSDYKKHALYFAVSKCKQRKKSDTEKKQSQSKNTPPQYSKEAIKTELERAENMIQNAGKFNLNYLSEVIDTFNHYYHLAKKYNVEITEAQQQRYEYLNKKGFNKENLFYHLQSKI